MGTETDYKIATKSIGTNSIKVVMNIYEGDTATESELNPYTNEMEDLNRYRRDGFLEKRTTFFPTGTSDNDILTVLNESLAIDQTRSSIPEQTNS